MQLRFYITANISSLTCHLEAKKISNSECINSHIIFISFNSIIPLLFIQFSHSVMPDCLWPCGPQHTRLPYPSTAPRTCSNSCPTSRWCHSTISFSVVPFSSYLQSFPTSGLFQWVSSSHQVAKVLEFQLQHQAFQYIFKTYFFRMDWLVLLTVQGTHKSLLQHYSSKVSILWRSAFFIVQLSYPYMTTAKTIALTRQTFVGKVMSLLFNTLSRLFIAFLPKSKPNLHQKKVMVTVWWSAASLIHQNFLNPSETITSEKYAQQINEMHWKLQCLQLASVKRMGSILLHDNAQ